MNDAVHAGITGLKTLSITGAASVLGKILVEIQNEIESPDREPERPQESHTRQKKLETT